MPSLMLFSAMLKGLFADIGGANPCQRPVTGVDEVAVISVQLRKGIPMTMYRDK